MKTKVFAALTAALALGLSLGGCGSGASGTTDKRAESKPGGQNVEIHGAGATFPAPLYAKWIAEYNNAQQNVKLDYQAIGSGGGIKGITDRTVQFGASDGPMTDEQLKEASAKNGGDKIVHLPTLAGPDVIIYKLEGVSDLVLDGETIAHIYLGKITKWNDPKIAKLNKAALPDKDIVVAHRSDGSGTTWIFTNYLCKVSPEWSKSAGNATSVKWPVGIGGKGSDGVAAAVNNSDGGIGYVELAYVENAKLSCAAVVNKAGKAVKPTIDGVNEAAKNSAEIPDDFRISITDAPGDASYPISGYTYLLVYEDLSYLKNKALASEMLKFIEWCENNGQDMAAPGYARLSKELQQKVAEKLKTIKFDGEPIEK